MIPGVYSITSKVNQKIYVGSSVNIARRVRDHQWQLKTGVHLNPALQAHVNKYGLDDLVFEVMEVEPDLTLRLGLEQLLITALYGEGCFNLSKDACAPMTGRKASPETRARQSAARTGLKASPEARANMSKAQKGRVVSPEARAKMSAARTGKKLSPEALAARPVPKFTDETRRKMSEAGRGRPKSEEHKAKIGAANRGRTPSPETKAKISAGNKGKKRSPEVREKLSAARQKYLFQQARMENKS